MGFWVVMKQLRLVQYLINYFLCFILFIHIFIILFFYYSVKIEQITAEYKVRALQYHPDKNEGNKEAEVKFQQLKVSANQNIYTYIHYIYVKHKVYCITIVL